MINKEEIIKYLNENGISDIEELDTKEDLLVLRFFYDFDEDEVKAAEAYADSESGEDRGDNWYEESYLPYLNDVAVDNVGEILEDASDDFDLEVQFVSYDIEKENIDYCEFIGIIFDKSKDYDLEEVLEKLDI